MIMLISIYMVQMMKQNLINFILCKSNLQLIGKKNDIYKYFPNIISINDVHLVVLSN